MSDQSPSKARPPAPSGAPRPDASMDLLRQISQEALEPGYAEAATRGRAKKSRIWSLAAAMVVGAVIAVAGVDHLASAPADQAERAQLVKQITQMQSNVSGQQEQVRQLTQEVSDLQSQVLPASQARGLDDAQQAAGAVAMTGPGVVVTVDDAPQATSDDQRVSDADLRVLVNGLWESGAEAVAVNGQRIVSTTSIREAGSAITVNYVSLTAPYRVVALGNEATMPADLAATRAGQWWTYVHSNYGLVWTVDASSSLDVPAGTVITPTVARAKR